jgi:hypothetical protein
MDRRPNTLPGLLLLLVRRSPRWRLLLLLGAGSLVIGAVAVIAAAVVADDDRDGSDASSPSRAGDPCKLEGPRWAARVALYDHLQTIRFTRGGRGELVLGSGQAVRLDLSFRHAHRGWRRLKLYDWRHREDGRPLPAKPRHARYRLKRGNFRFVRKTPGGEEKLRFRCRLRFSRSPFPTGEPADRDYYGVRVDP